MLICPPGHEDWAKTGEGILVTLDFSPLHSGTGAGGMGDLERATYLSTWLWNMAGHEMLGALGPACCLRLRALLWAVTKVSPAVMPLWGPWLGLQRWGYS